MENKREIYKLDINMIEEYVYRGAMFNTPDGNIDKKGVFKKYKGNIVLNLHKYIRMFKEEIACQDVVVIPDFVNIILKTDAEDDLSNKHIIFPTELSLIVSARDLEEKNINELHSSFKLWKMNFENSILDFSKCYKLNKFGLYEINTHNINSIIFHSNLKQFCARGRVYNLYPKIVTINYLYAPGVEELEKGAFENIIIKNIEMPNLNKMQVNSLDFDGVVNNIVINEEGWIEEGAINPDCVQNLYLPIYNDIIGKDDITRYSNMITSNSSMNAVLLMEILDSIRKEVNSIIMSHMPHRKVHVNIMTYYKIAYLYIIGEPKFILCIESLLVFKEHININKEPMNIYLYHYDKCVNVFNKKYKKVTDIKNKYNQKVVACIWEEV